MRYSVLICTHNRCDVLPRALEAIGRLEAPNGAAVELLVVDNASTDGTADIVRMFAQKAPFEVRYIRELRLGHSFALNAGIAAARGDIIAFTDDDACPFPDWLRQLDRTFAEHQADLVFGKAIPLWETKAPPWFSSRFNPNFALLDYGPESFVVKDARTPFFGVNHACRRGVLAALRGYREDLGLFGAKGGTGNDLDLMERALSAGKRIVYSPDAVVRHIIPEARCRKVHHRRAAWGGGEFYYAFLKNKLPDVPWLFGLPRYFHRLALGDLFSYLKAMARMRPDESFYYQLRLIRYVGLIHQARRCGLRRDDSPVPVVAERPVSRPAHFR